MNLKINQVLKKNKSPSNAQKYSTVETKIKATVEPKSNYYDKFVKEVQSELPKTLV